MKSRGYASLKGMIEKIADSLIRAGHALARRNGHHEAEAGKQKVLPARRSDSYGYGMPFLWQNVGTGQGSLDDNLSGWMPGSVWPLDWNVLLSLQYHGISRRIVSYLPERAFAKGLMIVYSGDKKREERKFKRQIEREAERLRLLERAYEAALWGRHWGGAIIMVTTKDGLPDQPIRPKRVRRIESLLTVEAPRAYPIYPRYNPLDDDSNRRYPEHHMYYVQPYGMDRTLTVHHSRLAPFGGLLTRAEDRWGFFRGWDASVLQTAWDTLRRMEGNSQAAARALNQAGRKILKTNLFDIIAGSAGKDGLGALLDRLRLIITTESLANCMAIDKEEEYQFINQTFSGIGEITDRDKAELAAVLGIPISYLFGVAPAGFNATGEKDERQWLEMVNAYQSQQLVEPLDWIVWLIALSCGSQDSENWGVVFPNPAIQTERDRAELYKMIAEADAIYLQLAVLDQQRLAVHRFNPAGYNSEPPALPELDAGFLSRSADRNHTELEPGEEGT